MKMQRVAICDDARSALNIVSGAIERVFETNNVELELYSFQSAQKLDETISANKYDLMLLDIDMPGMDGIQYGKKLRKSGNNTEIIYISNCENRVFESFEVHPFGFIRKSRFLKDVTDVISQYLKSVEKYETRQTICLTTHYGNRIIKTVDQIFYFEGNGTYQTLCGNDGEKVEIVSKMRDLENSLSEHGFIRIHKGYLVNFRAIARIDAAEVTLVNGQKLPLSRRKSKEVKDQYLQFGRKFGVLMF